MWKEGRKRIAVRILRSEGQEQKAWLGEPSTDAREMGRKRRGKIL